MKQMRGKIDKTKRVFIAGGGNIGLSLAKELESKGYSVKLIEFNPARADEIADSGEQHGSASGRCCGTPTYSYKKTLKAPMCFALSPKKDEINLLSANLAKRLGAKRVMALVNRPAFVDYLDHKDINNIISPRLATNGSVLAHIRRGDVVAVHSLRRGRAEAIEAIAHGRRKIIQGCWPRCSRHPVSARHWGGRYCA